jgi:hypothetical protein
MKERNFLGECMGIRLVPRGEKDNHVMLVLMVEDDGNWHEEDSFSSYWLPELMEMLQTAQEYMSLHCKPITDDQGCHAGWEFKK